MKPVDPGEEYGRLVTYGSGQPEYEPLPARVDHEGGTFTIWELSEDDLAAIRSGARVGLRLLTFGLPLQPLYLAVESTAAWPYTNEVQQ